MCGILGLFAYKCDTKELDPRVEAMLQRMLFMESLVFMEPRGKDATGISLLWDDYETAVIKQPIQVTQFAQDDGLWGEDFTNPNDEDANCAWFMRKWMRGLPETQLRHAIGHVRLGTKGSEYIPHNNHPIIVSSNKLENGGDIAPELLIGVHNGGIRNDSTLFNKYKFDRVGQVDSEVIFQMMFQYRDDLTIENLKKTFDELTGAYAVMAYNPTNLDEVACMRHVRPLDGAYIPEMGALVQVSEKKFLIEALDQYERWRVREGGNIVTWRNEDDELEELGEVYDLFPYLTVDWYNSIDEGVWVLDLSTEVEATTKAKDLIKVEKIFKAATTGYTTGRWGGGVRDTRSSTSATSGASAGTKVVKDDDKDETESGGVSDLTNYESTDEAADAMMADLIAEVEGEDGDDENTTEVTVEQVSEDEVVDDDDLEMDCPYPWDERTSQAMDSLYGAEEGLEDKMALSRMTASEIRALLDKYLIKTKDDDEAATIMASFYDIIFPEGFALGFGVGYRQAGEDIDVMSEGAEAAEDELREHVAQMEDALEGKELAMTNLLESLRSERKTKQAATQYVGLMKPLLAHLLWKVGAVDAESGEFDRMKIAGLMHEAGINQSLTMSERIVAKVLKAKARTGKAGK